MKEAKETDPRKDVRPNEKSGEVPVHPNRGSIQPPPEEKKA